jgi:hypothetical protein
MHSTNPHAHGAQVECSREADRKEALRGPLGRRQTRAARCMVSLSEARYCAMGARCTQARFLDGRPQKLRSTNKSGICDRCEESGLSLKELAPEEDSGGAHYKGRRGLAFKDELVVQHFMQRGPFWKAVCRLRERRGIVARTSLPPSGHGISSLIMPKTEREGDFFQERDRWIKDLETIEDECIPARYRDSAEWKGFISACVLFDPPPDQLEEFAVHGDPRSEERETVPLRAMAPILWSADEKELEAVYLGFFERLLEELGKRHLEPLGLRMDDLLKDVLDNTEVNEDFHRSRLNVRRRWHIVVEGGVSEDDVRKAFAAIPRPDKSRLAGGASKRSPLIALRCAILYDRENPVEKDGHRRWTYQKLAKRYGLPSASSAKDHVRDGRQILSKLGSEKL